MQQTQTMQFLAYFAHFLNTWSVLFDLHLERQLPDTQWTVIRKDIISKLPTPEGKAFWDEVGKLAVQEGFCREVDKILASEETSYKIV